ILGEKVKSYGEMDIANFLYKNNINYKYEAAYKFDTRTEEKSQYYPDFYLPDYDIYIEYFGINRQGEVPPWFTGKDGKSPTEVYRESMEWKEKIHKENNTTMISCFAYEKTDGIIFLELEKHLQANNVELSPKISDEIWQDLNKENSSILDGIIELFETVINLLKSNNYSIDYFSSLAKSNRHRDFIELIKPLFKAYDLQLKADNEIDFNDMINFATEYVRTGKVKNHYSYVIVDEYQDISKARYQLLAELRKSFNFDLFCVGDDWQSIYRFCGSDINYILNFEKFWGKTTISKIETTYRFTESLIEISGKFITLNPKQIKKNIKGMSIDKRFSLGEINGYQSKYIIDFMAERIDDLPQDSSIFFIGRYSFDVDILKSNGLFDCQYNNITGVVDVKYNKRPDLKMCFMTAHKSKGLQSDYVFIINNKNSRMGFPSKMQDDPILDLLLDSNETFPYAEERRLYYVALTRAKVKAFILTEDNNIGDFAKELHNRYEKELKRERFSCPICGGRLLVKTGPFGEFYGCENYKKTGCRYKKKIKATQEKDIITKEY
ncbi:MAG: UvrD-helicase domain-containing protein, partial [Alphaproteobacteria bacterium]|nr:UvrD-helicase domain-containing protein [Alphaproteobacteria bacterium]